MTSEVRREKIPKPSCLDSWLTYTSHPSNIGSLLSFWLTYFFLIVIYLLNQVARKPRQLNFDYRQHGGARASAGRKPVGARAGVSHRTRAAIASRHPVHVTVKMHKELGNLRQAHTFEALNRSLVSGKLGRGFRVVHFSVQRDHVHLICEAKDALSLGKGMQGLCIRMARALNKTLKRKGSVFKDRYHAQILKTPRQVRHALAYVLNNFRKHREVLGDVPRTLTDEYSSAPFFDGFKGIKTKPQSLDDAPITEPHTWLIKKGWRRYSLIAPWEVPGVRTKQNQFGNNPRR